MSRQNEADQGQPSMRRPAIVYDQHKIPGHPLFSDGRPWGCTVEKNSGLPVGMIKPRGWRAPWIPPQGPEVYQFDKNNPSRFTINYTFLLDQRVKDLEEKVAERQAKAVARGWNPTDPERQEAIDQLCGKLEDMNRPEIIAACIQGDRWILGATDVVNPKVQQYLPKKKTRVEQLLSKMPDFSVPDEDTAERYMDLQEQHDPENTPKGRVPVKPTKQPKPAKPVAA